MIHDYKPSHIETDRRSQPRRVADRNSVRYAWLLAFCCFLAYVMGFFSAYLER